MEEKEVKNIETKPEEKNDTKKAKNKIRRNLVLIVLAIALVIIYIIQRGEYLEIKEIGENYIPIFWQNFKNIVITFALNFLIVFGVMYITTSRVKEGLKSFFADEKKEMPKLPQKSIAFIVAILVAIFTSGFILEKALLCFNSTQFVIYEPVFGYDIGYFVFIWPFIELVVMYALVAGIASTVYAALYYLIVFNVCFDGVSRESFKKSIVLNQALNNVKVLIMILAVLVLVETQNVGVQKFIILNDSESENYALFGAGTTEINIKLAAYGLLSVVIVFSVFRVIKQFKKGNTKKVVKSILIVPIYLVAVTLIML